MVESGEAYRDEPPQRLHELAQFVLAEAELTGRASAQYDELDIEVVILEMERIGEPNE